MKFSVTVSLLFSIKWRRGGRVEVFELASRAKLDILTPAMTMMPL
jgi:hypothetical protein